MVSAGLIIATKGTMSL